MYAKELAYFDAHLKSGVTRLISTTEILTEI
jgi:hypothetical protein